MNIEFNIPAIGHNPGSIGWLADKLDNTEVDVRKSKSGLTCLYAKFPEDDDWTFLARPTTGPQDEYAAHPTHRIKSYSGVKMKVVAVTTDNDLPEPDASGLFGHSPPLRRRSLPSGSMVL